MLTDIHLEVPRRGHVAIVGPSGAGKTTLFSLLMRFVDPRSGTIELDGRPYADWTVADVRARFTYVEQDTPLVPGTIAENLLFTEPDADPGEVEQGPARRAADVDSRGPARRAVDAGEQRYHLRWPAATTGDRPRRRPAAGGAAAGRGHRPVDGLTEAAIQHCIHRAAAAGTVLTIAHRLSTVLDADQIIVLEAGRIRDRGTHAELLGRDDLYRQLVEALRIAATSEPEPAGHALR